MLLRPILRCPMLRKHLRTARDLTKCRRNFRTCTVRLQTEGSQKNDDAKPNDDSDKSEMVVYRTFEDVQDKNKQTYLDMLHIYTEKEYVYRRGHVEFVYAALKNMADFGVEKDLAVYKSLINVLPKGKFVATNIFQVEFMHYPKQQQCMIDLLEQMEDNGVCPDFEVQDMLTNVFGSRAHPVRKLGRMMYWMPKFKNLSPWLLPSEMPSSVFELAKLAIERITSVDAQSKVKVYQTKELEDSIDDTWIVSGQSPLQQKLLQEHDIKSPIYVEGGFRIWLRKEAVDYFILRANAKPFTQEAEDLDNVSQIKVPFLGFSIQKIVKDKIKVVPSVHEQEDGVIFAVCATGSSSKDSLLSWIRHLEKDGNPNIANAQIVFTLKQGRKELATVADLEKEEEKKKISDL